MIKRYRFGRVFWTVLAVNLFFLILGMIALFISPGNTSGTTNWEKLTNWKSLMSNVISVIFQTLFYYYTVNSFYTLWTERKKSSDFIHPVMIALLGLIAYYTLTHFLFVDGKVNIEFRDNEMNRKLTIGLMVFSYAPFRPWHCLH